MPNQTNNQRRRRRGGRRRRPNPNTVMPVAVGAGSRFTTTLFQHYSTTGAIGTISVHELKFVLSQYSFSSSITQVKIKTVGIMVLPQSYAEFVVRGVGENSINTRAELISQADCVKQFALTKPRLFIYRPNQAIYKTFQDVSSSTTEVSSGLWLHFTGQNQLNPTGSEIVLQISYRVIAIMDTGTIS